MSEFMRTVPVFLIAMLFPVLLAAQRLPDASAYIEGEGLRIPLYEDFDALAPLFEASGDTTVVVNFWATWCAPCVEELPHFEELTRTRGSRKLRVILVSLDFRRQWEKRLLPFIRKNDLRSTVVVLDDADANAWIDRVDPAWSGAIPATMVFNATRREFREKSFTREELNTLIDSFTGTQE